MMRATDLLGSELATESGESLGRVFDLRARRDDGDRWQITGLVVGRRGLAERFGIAHSKRAEPMLAGDCYQWEALIRVERGQLIVRDGTRPI
jgi:sporulation protein YlmC with PRC-barrel domain